SNQRTIRKIFMWPPPPAPNSGITQWIERAFGSNVPLSVVKGRLGKRIKSRRIGSWITLAEGLMGAVCCILRAYRSDDVASARTDRPGSATSEASIPRNSDKCACDQRNCANSKLASFKEGSSANARKYAVRA